MSVSGFRFVFGFSHSSCKFLCLFRFAAFLHSSCSVVVSYFMFIPVFVILLFSVTVFRSLGEINFYVTEDPKRVKSVCDFSGRLISIY